MSQLKNEVDILRRVPLFSGVDSPKLKLLAFTSQVVRYRKDETLFREGDVGDSAYVILSGNARVFATTPQGRIDLAEVGETDFVGEIAILCDVPRTATVEATSDLTALKVNKECFGELLTTFPSMGIAMLRELGFRLSRTTADLVAAESRNARG
ncbi:transcriptional regulator [Aureimonas sp. SA4125]|uniref:cyclic nucleotide-binding domain-containing protein n=1 Tax=Aureimonas sp. SA4125 TaxID=2826993 RepID=UPI001CC6D157|nr:Crp/Fnr family transcriptional regulator [Aureimonas sp. SA4125]BDA82555.1 transcriptional regulator [Aureimonas sp. SA4125]